MKNPRALILGLVSSCLLLAGCTDADWDHALNFVGPSQDTEAASAPAPAPQPEVPSQVANVPAAAPVDSGSAAFCQGVATQDATRNDFDAATQKRVFAQSYAQCLTIYTR